MPLAMHQVCETYAAMKHCRLHICLWPCESGCFEIAALTGNLPCLEKVGDHAEQGSIEQPMATNALVHMCLQLFVVPHWCWSDERKEPLDGSMTSAQHTFVDEA